MKMMLFKSGEYSLSNTIVLDSLDVGLVGEEGTIIAPEHNVLAFLGVGDEDIKCSKCDTFLAMKMGKNQLQNLSIKCPNCGYKTKV